MNIGFDDYRVTIINLSFYIVRYIIIIVIYIIRYLFMIERNIYKQIKPWIEREEIVFINGPRQVGKSTLMKQIQKDMDDKGHKTFYYNLENPNDLALVENYNLFLKAVSSGKVFVFLDEIQLHSRPSNFLKFLYDEHRENIKLFVSGSANLEIKAKLQDSLVGRKRTFQLRPFDFKEFLKAKDFEVGRNPITDSEKLKYFLDEYLLYGGLPKIALEDNINLKIDLLEEYTATYIGKDIRHMIVENHVLTFNNLLIFLAKIMGSLKNNSEISKELQLGQITLNRYLDILRHTFVVDFLQPYFSNEITRIKKATKIYFFDNGVRNSILSDFTPLSKRRDAGALFENCVHLHLQEKYNHVFYLRTTSGNEIDFVCKTGTGGLHAYEAKYSSFNYTKLGRGLKELINKISFEKVYLINKNFTKTSGEADFLSFEDFAGL